MDKSGVVSKFGDAFHLTSVKNTISPYLFNHVFFSRYFDVASVNSIKVAAMALAKAMILHSSRLLKATRAVLEPHTWAHLETSGCQVFAQINKPGKFWIGIINDNHLEIHSI